MQVEVECHELDVKTFGSVPRFKAVTLASLRSLVPKDTVPASW